LLNFPMRIICKDDCKGMCPDCGADLNLERCRCTKKEGFENKIRIKGD